MPTRTPVTHRRCEDVLDLVGGTPMVPLRRILPKGAATVLAKLEYINPSGSLKDRIALHMIEEAERRGDLKPGMCVVEPTSGNTGAGLALICAMKGYPMIAVMPEAMSAERAGLIRAFGARLVLTPCRSKKPGMFGKEDIDRVIEKAQEIAAHRGFYMPNQFENPDNPAAHAATAREIWKQTGGRVDAFVMGVGTAGTLMGVGRWIRKHNPRLRLVAVEPTGSAVLSGCEPGPHKLQGIGEGFIPAIYRRELVDEVARVSDEEAKAGACRLARHEGILAGYSGGANVMAALKVARRLGSRKTVVTMIPDTGLKYLSTDLFRVGAGYCRKCTFKTRCSASERALAAAGV